MYKLKKEDTVYVVLRLRGVGCANTVFTNSIFEIKTVQENILEERPMPIRWKSLNRSD